MTTTGLPRKPRQGKTSVRTGQTKFGGSKFGEAISGEATPDIKPGRLATFIAPAHWFCRNHDKLWLDIA